MILRALPSSLLPTALVLATASLACATSRPDPGAEGATSELRRPQRSADQEDAAADADAATPPVFAWPVPEGYGAETIPFPLSFAPELSYRGVEELRFAPKFFSPESETYFTYSFAFVLEPAAEDAPLPFEAERFALDLDAYYTGLMAAVSGVPQANEDHRAEIAMSGVETFRGTVFTHDGFGDGRALTLHLEGETRLCGRRRIILSSLSPRLEADGIWRKLAEQRATFRCL